MRSAWCRLLVLPHFLLLSNQLVPMSFRELQGLPKVIVINRNTGEKMRFVPERATPNNDLSGGFSSFGHPLMLVVDRLEQMTGPLPLSSLVRLFGPDLIGRGYTPQQVDELANQMTAFEREIALRQREALLVDRLTQTLAPYMSDPPDRRQNPFHQFFSGLMQGFRGEI